MGEIWPTSYVAEFRLTASSGPMKRWWAPPYRHRAV